MGSGSPQPNGNPNARGFSTSTPLPSEAWLRTKEQDLYALASQALLPHFQERGVRSRSRDIMDAPIQTRGLRQGEVVIPAS